MAVAFLPSALRDQWVSCSNFMNKKTEKLILQYEKACNGIGRQFEKKQEIEFDGWVANDIGSVAGFIGQYYFNMEDMIYDLTTDQPKDMILDWQDYVVTTEKTHVNYRAYSKGMR